MLTEPMYTLKVETEVVCDGCLARDRKLSPLDDLRDLFYRVLSYEDKDHVFGVSRFQQNEPELCWECSALLRNTLKFQQRVSRAQTALHRAIDRMQIQTSLCISTIGKSFKDFCDLNIVYDENEQETYKIEQPELVKIEIDSTFEDIHFNQDDIYEDKNDVNDTGYNLKEEKKRKVKFKKGTTKSRREKARYVYLKNEKEKRNYRKVDINTGEWKSLVLKEKEMEFYLNAEFKCDSCVLRFASKDSLHLHNRKQHNSKNKVKCDICFTRLSNKKCLETHMQHHTVKYKCNMCENEFSSFRRFNVHFKMHHWKAVKCLECGSLYKGRREFFEHHFALHAVFSCDHCSRTYRTRAQIIKHIQKKHTKLRLKCDLCDVNFKEARTMKEHMRRKHTVCPGEDTYCVECDRSFDNKDLFRQHLNNVAHKPPVKKSVPCPVCGKVFGKHWNMTNHYRLYHERRADHRCDQCDKSYVTAYRLRVHVATQHLNIKPPKKHVCDHCGRGFTTRRTLDNHVRTHTGERPFACPLCSASFAQSAALASHAARLHKLRTTYRKGAPVFDPV